MKVLILIILEYIYICYSYDSVVAINRLNPYYTGIHLHGFIVGIIYYICVLILIILEYIYILKQAKRLWFIVLILIILEYIYIY